MRNVDRTEEPAVLKRNARRWTEELLAAIEEANASDDSVPDAKWNRYNHRDVKEELKRMYSGLCCYCESRIGDVAYEHIEHRKPKKLFPESTFAWGNLHLGCPMCNGAKSDKWDEDFPILDAVEDRPISAHLTFHLSKVGVERAPLSDRGAVTISHTNLNREALAQTRQKVWIDTWPTVQTLREREKQEGNTPRVQFAKGALRREFKHEHGSLVRHIARAVLNDI